MEGVTLLAARVGATTTVVSPIVARPALDAPLTRVGGVALVAVFWAIGLVVSLSVTVVAHDVASTGRLGVGVIAVAEAAVFTVDTSGLCLPEAALTNESRCAGFALLSGRTSTRRVRVEKRALFALAAALFRLPEAAHTSKATANATGGARRGTVYLGDIGMLVDALVALTAALLRLPEAALANDGFAGLA